MSRAHTAMVLALTLLFLLAACEPVAVRSPSGLPKSPVVYPAGNPPSQPAPASPTSSAASPPPQLSSAQNQTPSPNQPQPQISGSQRTEYVWEKMMQGVAMGGAVGGPFGAGGGLIIGLIAGLLTADAHYTALQAQIQTEQTKDRELEAQIEREIERQRELEGQVGKDSQISENKKIEEREKKSPAQDGSKGEVTSVAVLSKREPAPSAPGSPFKNVEIKDLNRDGIPDLWIYYNPLRPGEIVRQEEATRGDGSVDTWSHFKDGKLVRREVDTTGNGRPDTVYYYEGDNLAREERDQKGDGHVTYRAFYENGRVSRVEKSSHTDGKLDNRTVYDTAKEGEVVLREEIDLNGDGDVDLWSYYENGRLVRRDVSAVGLEYLARQEKGLHIASPDKPASAPPNQ